MKIPRLVFVVVVALALTTQMAALSYSVSVVGGVACDGDAVPFVTVKVMDSDGPLRCDDTFFMTKADASGCFSDTGSASDPVGTPDPYLRVEYQYSGSYGCMDIEDKSHYIRYHTTSVHAYATSINVFTIFVTGNGCKAYLFFYRAMQDFHTRVGSPLPYRTLYVITDAVAAAGTPYSLTHTIFYPSSLLLNRANVLHEFSYAPTEL